MHIGFRTSQGRGEYEVVGSQSAYAASALEGWTFSIRWPDGVVRDTGLWLEGAASGKPRLRSLLDPPVQIGKILGAMLLLPDSTRSRESRGIGEPVLVEKKYQITKFGFGPDTEFAPVTDAVTIDPTFVEVANAEYTEVFGVASRWGRIQEVFTRIQDLPLELQEQLTSYHAFLATGEVIDSSVRQSVRSLQRTLPKLVHGGSPEADPLPQLEQLLGLALSDKPQLPEPATIAEESAEIKVRSAHEYRLAKTRGASARVFARAVSYAYGHRCMFCGAKLGGVADIRSGIESAHILAWSAYDLDVVQNGIALCKLHHWAFDAGLIVPVYKGDKIELRLTKLAGHLEIASRALIGSDHFEVPNEWLPLMKSDWPGRLYLTRLYDDLAIELLGD